MLKRTEVKSTETAEPLSNVTFPEVSIKIVATAPLELVENIWLYDG
jgi:hypothetical protein